MNGMDMLLNSFDDYIEAMVDSGSYTWKELKTLLSILANAESESVFNGDLDGLEPGRAIKSIIERFENHKPIIGSPHPGATSIIGYTLKDTKEDNNGNYIIHKSGILWDRKYFFIVNTKFQMFGICRYEFELGKLDHKNGVASIKTKVIFQGHENNEDYPRISLDVNEDESITIKKEEQKNDIKIENKEDDADSTVLTKKVLINHFLLFRVIGSILVLGIWGLIADYLDRTSSSSGGDLFVGFGVITILNVPIQIYYLIRAFFLYKKQRKTKD